MGLARWHVIQADLEYFIHFFTFSVWKPGSVMSAIFKMPYILFNRGIKIRLVWVKN